MRVCKFYKNDPKAYWPDGDKSEKLSTIQQRKYSYSRRYPHYPPKIDWISYAKSVFDLNNCFVKNVKNDRLWRKDWKKTNRENLIKLDKLSEYKPSYRQMMWKRGKI